MNIKRILFPTDFSEASKPAEKTACDLADQFEAELHVLHILHDLFLLMPQTADAVSVSTELLKKVSNSAEEVIHSVPPTAWSLGRRVVRVVRIGPIYDTIVKYAADNDINLIVVGTHGRTGLKHAVLGSVAERVVQYAPCSVLTVRSDPTAAVSQGASEAASKTT